MLEPGQARGGASSSRPGLNASLLVYKSKPASKISEGKQIENLDQVKWAVLEPTGKITLIKS